MKNDVEIFERDERPYESRYRGSDHLCYGPMAMCEENDISSNMFKLIDIT